MMGTARPRIHSGRFSPALCPAGFPADALWPCWLSSLPPLAQHPCTRGRGTPCPPHGSWPGCTSHGWQRGMLEVSRLPLPPVVLSVPMPVAAEQEHPRCQGTSATTSPCPLCPMHPAFPCTQRARPLLPSVGTYLPPHGCGGALWGHEHMPATSCWHIITRHWNPGAASRGFLSS